MYELAKGNELLIIKTLLVVLSLTIPIIGFFFVRTLKLVDFNQAKMSETILDIVKELSYLKGEHDLCKGIVRKARRK